MLKGGMGAMGGMGGDMLKGGLGGGMALAGGGMGALAGGMGGLAAGLPMGRSEEEEAKINILQSMVKYRKARTNRKIICSTCGDPLLDRVSDIKEMCKEVRMLAHATAHHGKEADTKLRHEKIERRESFKMMAGGMDGGFGGLGAALPVALNGHSGQRKSLDLSDAEKEVNGGVGYQSNQAVSPGSGAAGAIQNLVIAVQAISQRQREQEHWMRKQFDNLNRRMDDQQAFASPSGGGAGGGGEGGHDIHSVGGATATVRATDRLRERLRRKSLSKLAGII
jgi:hypothetical protein